MNSRSRKYYESRKAGTGNKKGSLTKTTDVEQKEQSQENSAPPKEPDQAALQENQASQDDTGGGNDTGKRIDEN